MTPKALKALKSSIAHWRRMATGKARPGEVPLGSNCALCVMFYKETGSCDGCPVSEAGHGGCCGTPYFDARDAWIHNSKQSPAFKAAAQAELSFLQSLLPKKP